MPEKRKVGDVAATWIFANIFVAFFILPLVAYFTDLASANSISLALPKILIQLVRYITIGVSLGLVQSLVIKQWVKPKSWILATTVSWTFGLPISGIVVVLIHTKILPLIPVLQFPPSLSFLFIAVLFPLYVAVESIILGALIGVSQWLVLRKSVPEAKVWIGANLVSCIFSNGIVARSFYPTLGNDVVARNIYLYPDNIAPLNIASSELLLMMIFYSGIITGIVLEKMFNNARKSRQSYDT